MRALTALAILFPLPLVAAAAEGSHDYGFFSLMNTNFVVLLGFIVFIAILLYYRVPGMLLGLLDKRAEGIRKDLAEARELREEAQSLLASYERKQKEVQEQSDRIVENARREARTAAEQAKADMDARMERRLETAKEQIAQAEEDAVREVRNRAVTVAIAAARRVLSEQMDAERGDRMIDRSIDRVGQRLN